MTKPAVVTLLLLFAARPGSADPAPDRGSFKRVGGWRLDDASEVASCGTRTRKAVLGQAVKLRRVSYSVGRSTAAGGAADDGVMLLGALSGPMQRSSSFRRIKETVIAIFPTNEDRAAERGVHLVVSLFFTDEGVMLVYGRSVYRDDAVVCQDAYISSVE